MENLTISDENLKPYQVGFAKVYRDYAEATRLIVKVRETKNITEAKAAQAQVKRASKLERELGEQINDYCRENNQ